MASHNIPGYSETDAFQVFAAMCWEQHKNRHPTANIDPNRFAEISTGRWKAMTQEQKNAFYYKFKEEEAEKAKPLKRKGSQDDNTPKSKKTSKPIAGTSKEIIDSKKPKPKKTAFNFFSSEKGAEIRKLKPTLKRNEVASELNELWQNIDEKSKQKYIDMATNDKSRFEEEMKAHQSSTSNVLHDAVKDPNKPKKVRKAFTFFSSEKGAEIRKLNPALKPADVVKEVTELWQNMNDESKQKYNEMATNDQSRFEEEMKAYKLSSSKDQGKPVKDLKPKKGRKAFYFFSSEKGPELRKLKPTLNQNEILKEVTELWENLDDESKEKYNDLAIKDQSRFEEEMNAYKLSSNKDLYKAVKDPNKPKKGASGYMFFNAEVSQQIRKELQSKNSTASMGEISKEVGKRWQDADEETKRKYENMAIADKQRYENEMKDYKPPPLKITKKAMKKTKDPNKPKGKTGAFMYFSSEIGNTIRKENPDKPITEISKLLGNLWKEMDEQKRKKYDEMAENDKKRYEHEMELYKEGKFVRKNNEDELTTPSETSAKAVGKENSP